MATKRQPNSHGTHKLLLVTWHDAQVDAGWVSTTETSTPAVCKSVGWLISDNEKAMVLGADIGDHEGTTETNRRIAIPKDWVIDVKDLK